MKHLDETTVRDGDGTAAVDPSWSSAPGSLRRLSLTFALVAAAVWAGLGGEIVALAVLLGLILLHEGGHYAAARACKMTVEQFFVGFGPVIASVRRGGVEYGIKAIPLGGYVKIAGMSADDIEHPTGYQRSTRLRKIAVVGAGPATNFLVALVIGFITLFAVGLPESTLTVDRIDPRLGAAEAGIRPGDTIVSVNGKMVDEWNDVGDSVAMLGPGRDVEIVVERNGLRYMYPVRILSDAGVARIGVTAETEYVTRGFTESASGTVTVVRDVAVGSLQGVKQLATGFGDLVAGLFGNEVAPENRPLSPVGAVQIGAEVGGRSLFDAMQLIVVYSTFLGVFNLIPLLPLDGGRIAVVLFETVASAVRRRKVDVSPATMTRLSVAFTMLLLSVGLIALVLDITQPVLQ